MKTHVQLSYTTRMTEISGIILLRFIHFVIIDKFKMIFIPNFLRPFFGYSNKHGSKTNLSPSKL